MHDCIVPDNLEPQFLQPEGWRWHSFERDGRTIRFGCVTPKDKIPDAVVVCLQGVREFGEKYFEIARWCNEQNLTFWMMDWVGQGQSTRLIEGSDKRHSHGFDSDIDDLHYLIMEYIKHSSVHPDKGRIPLAMLAHSMGAHIGLRYMSKYPDTFECAALSAPMIDFKVFKNIPAPLAIAATWLCSTMLGTSYIPNGNDWDKRTESARLSSDSVRDTVDDRWCKDNAGLRCGDITYRWLHEAYKSCRTLQKADVIAKITTKCLFGISGKEDLVDNAKAHTIASKISDHDIIEYPDAFHEILMERDEIRDDFLNNFYAIIKETIIDQPQTLKPF